MKTLSSFKETAESVKEKDDCIADWVPQYGTANLDGPELFSLVRVRGINFRVSKGLQGECLQGEYKYIYGMKKRIVLI